MCNIIEIIPTLLGAIVGGICTFAGSWFLMKKELSYQVYTARHNLHIALISDAGLCERIAEDFEQAGHGSSTLDLAEYIFTSKDLIFTAIKTHQWLGNKDFSDGDKHIILEAYHFLTSVVRLSNKECDYSYLSTSLLEAHRRCREAADLITKNLNASQGEDQTK